MDEDDRTDKSVLGKVIGTATGWDQNDNWVILLYAMQLNIAGRIFVPSFPDGADMAVDYERGVVATYDDDGKETIHKADWSVFNEV